MDNDLNNLILSYDRAADERDKYEASDWKKDLRWKFLNILNTEGKSRLIDIGAGTGIHGKFFQEQGIKVTCGDLSPAHVEKCIEKGLKSFVLNKTTRQAANQLLQDSKILSPMTKLS